MRAIVDSIEGSAVQCLMENGDLLKVHKDVLPKEIQPGSILKLTFKLDAKATKKQIERMKS